MERSVERDGYRIVYDVEGDGSPILWIQGVGVHGPAWRPQTDLFARRHRCISFDNRGLGRSSPLPKRLAVEDMADDALAILDAESAARAHVVGHSLGGLIALQLALNHPRRVASLALLCTFADGPDAAPLSWRMIALGLQAQFGTRRMRRRGFLGLIMPPGPLTDVERTAGEMAALFGHDLADQPAVSAPQLRAMRRCRLSNRLTELGDLPTLVVSATHDPIAPPALGRKLAAGIPAARFVEIPVASHGLPITHAEAVNTLLGPHFEAAERSEVG